MLRATLALTNCDYKGKPTKAFGSTDAMSYIHLLEPIWGASFIPIYSHCSTFIAGLNFCCCFSTKVLLITESRSPSVETKGKNGVAQIIRETFNRSERFQKCLGK